MTQTLHLGLIQMPLSPETQTNIQYFSDKARALCQDPRRPHLIVGVEFGIGPEEIQEADGQAMQDLSALAAELGVWLLPGSMKLRSPGGGFTNSAPVFAPDGRLAGTTHKMVPWDTDLEKGTVPGKDYLVFDMHAPQTRFGVQICFDADFPEISRTLTMMGAEVLIQLSMDPDSIPSVYQSIKYARALENQVYYVYMNGSGDYRHYHLAGGSLVVSPEGHTLLQAGERPTTSIISLDLDRLRHCREHGSWDQVAQLQALYDYAPSQPLAGKERTSPVFSLPPFHNS